MYDSVTVFLQCLFTCAVAVYERSAVGTPYPSVIPAGFVSTVTTAEDGTSHSTVQIQFVDMATGETFIGPAGPPTASQALLTDARISSLVRGSGRITRIDTPPTTTSVSAASLLYQPEGSGLVNSGIAFRQPATNESGSFVTKYGTPTTVPASPGMYPLEMSDLETPGKSTSDLFQLLASRAVSL